MQEKSPAPRNRTINLSSNDFERLSKNLLCDCSQVNKDNLIDKTIHGDCFEIMPKLPDKFIDLMIVDPPYNLTKRFGSSVFKKTDNDEYTSWLDSWMKETVRLLKPHASIYVCGDWQSSTAIQSVCEKYFIIKNRITWEREKGRGASRNWKNCSEDIWFCTMSEDYYFDVNAVKLRKKVIAPYRDAANNPKDWEEGDDGNFRLTHPSNLMTDISVPFWSMPENSSHPTQKPEKLIAKLVLASSKEGDLVFDPFVGSGTTSVVASKLGRSYLGIEKELEYCCIGEFRLENAVCDKTIQGYTSGYFWERNTLIDQQKQNETLEKRVGRPRKVNTQESLF